MTNKQPEALRLADRLEADAQGVNLGAEGMGWEPSANNMHEAAAELRRLHEVETKYHESVGGFKRDLAEKLEQQRKKNIRLTDELRHLHEVNAELVEALKAFDDAAKDSKSIIGFSGKALPLLKKARAAIAKATGEQQ